MESGDYYPRIIESGLYISRFYGSEIVGGQKGLLRKFTFYLFNYEQIVCGFCPSVPLSKSRKLYHWACVLAGKYLDVDQVVDFSKYLDRFLRIKVSKYKKGDEERNVVDDLIELVIDPYEGNKPEYMSDRSWQLSREGLESHKQSLLKKL